VQPGHLDVLFFEALEHLRRCQFCKTQVLTRQAFLEMIELIYGDPPVPANRPDAPSQ